MRNWQSLVREGVDSVWWLIRDVPKNILQGKAVHVFYNNYSGLILLSPSLTTP